MEIKDKEIETWKNRGRVVHEKYLECSKIVEEKEQKSKMFFFLILP
jgi:hypothetical protein